MMLACHTHRASPEPVRSLPVYANSVEEGPLDVPVAHSDDRLPECPLLTIHVSALQAVMIANMRSLRASQARTRTTRFSQPGAPVATALAVNLIANSNPAARTTSPAQLRSVGRDIRTRLITTFEGA